MGEECLLNLIRALNFALVSKVGGKTKTIVTKTAIHIYIWFWLTLRGHMFGCCVGQSLE